MAYSHPVPKELKGEERIFSVGAFYLNKTGCIYNGAVTLLTGIVLSLTGAVIPCLVVGLVLNILVYPLAHSTVEKSKFDAGGVRKDKFYYRKFKYWRKKRLYLRIF